MSCEIETGPNGRPVFRYHGVVTVNFFGVLWTVMSFGAVVVSCFVLLTGKQGGAWFGVLVGFSAAFLGLLILTNYFKRSREIIVNDDGVSALAFWRTWRSIPWTEIARIDRIRRPMVTEWYTWRNGYEFVIRGRQNEEIWVTDRITSLAFLLSLLNRYVEEHHIPLVAFDRGGDTRSKIRATTFDPAERKRLLRDGYKTTLSSLTTK